MEKSVKRLIEIGWLVGDDLDETDYQAVVTARHYVLNFFQEQFSQFDWRIPIVPSTATHQTKKARSASMLYEGAYERDNYRWDFVIVFTAADLQSYYKPYALAMPSRTLAVAVISTARLSTTLPITASSQKSIEHKALRLHAIVMHLLGDLNGLEHSSRPESFLYEPQEIEDLDHMNAFAEDEQGQLMAAFYQVADLRLEEQSHRKAIGVLGFYFSAAWQLWGDIVSAVRQAKPWEFPFRLSRLSTAALSALFILLITAEAWDLGMSQHPLPMFGFSLVALLGTSFFIVKRQRLLMRYNHNRLTEQIAVTTIAICTVVVLGMAFTYLLLFAVTLVLASTLFGNGLITTWAASLHGQIGWQNYLTLGQLTASLGLVIGALGATFEGQEYFRHIAYVDEEL